MGNVAAGHFNAFQKERLGWLDYGLSPPITTVETNGLYTIEPLETGGTGPKAMAILKSTDPMTGQQTWYYLEYRQALGSDSFLAGNSNMLNGIVVHMASPVERRQQLSPGYDARQCLAELVRLVRSSACLGRPELLRP